MSFGKRARYKIKINADLPQILFYPSDFDIYYLDRVVSFLITTLQTDQKQPIKYKTFVKVNKVYLNKIISVVLRKKFQKVELFQSVDVYQYNVHLLK